MRVVSCWVSVNGKTSVGYKNTDRLSTLVDALKKRQKLHNSFGPLDRLDLRFSTMHKNKSLWLIKGKKNDNGLNSKTKAVAKTIGCHANHSDPPHFKMETNSTE